MTAGVGDSMAIEKGKMAFASAYSGFVYFMPIEGEMVIVLAYSGLVFSMTIEGEIDFVLAYSGFVGTMTIVGVSFRTGLRG